MTKGLILALGALALPAAGLAAEMPKHEYPTQARVEYVFECMHKHGGENYTTLYKCSCAIDKIADQIPYNQYVTLDTYQRGKNSHGERPEVLREGKLARNSRALLARVKHKANNECMLSPEDDADHASAETHSRHANHG